MIHNNFFNSIGIKDSYSSVTSSSDKKFAVMPLLIRRHHRYNFYLIVLNTSQNFDMFKIFPCIETLRLFIQLKMSLKLARI